MRAYFWGNYYLSAIQQGIQSLHCLSELYLKVRANRKERPEDVIDLYTWAADYKTVVILNAGEMSALEEVEKLMASEDNPYAWASWRESPESLNGCLTSVGIILPDRVYEEARVKKKHWRDWQNRKRLSEFEIEICDLINSTYMAR